MRWAVIGLAVLITLGGCSAVPLGNPAPQEQPIIIDLTNDTNETYTIELWYGPSPLEGVRVHESNKTDYYTEMGEVGVGVVEPYSATSLSFPEEATFYGRFTLDSNRTERWSMHEPYPDTVFVAVVYNNSGVVGWVEASCGRGQKRGLGVTVHDYGPSGSSGCI